MEKNKFEEHAPITIQAVENGYKIYQSRDAHSYPREQHGTAIPNGEYVFSTMEGALNFITRHFSY